MIVAPMIIRRFKSLTSNRMRICWVCIFLMAILWTLSYYDFTYCSSDRLTSLSLGRGCMTFGRSNVAFVHCNQPGLHSRSFPKLGNTVWWPSEAGVYRSGPLGTYLIVPLWIPTAMASLWMILIAARHHRLRQETHGKSLCSGCGYDLRGQLEARCPECGISYPFGDPPS